MARAAAAVGRLARVLEARLANPLFRRLLRSRWHWLASGWLAALSYVGPRSGRRITTPVAYARFRGGIVAVTVPSTTWWRPFSDPYPCRIWLRGRELEGVGTVLEGRDRRAALGAYAGQRRLLAGALAGGAADVDALAERDLVVVGFGASTDATPPRDGSDAGQ